MSLSVVYLRVLFWVPFFTYLTLHHWLTFYDMQFHFCVDDTQFYISFSTKIDLEVTHSLSEIEKCLLASTSPMSLSKLKLNKDKTELLYLYSKHSPQQFLPPLRFASDTILLFPFPRNICVIFDNTMTIIPEVNSIGTIYLRKLPRPLLALAHAFVSSKLDHSNSLLYNVPNYIIRQLLDWLHVSVRTITSTPSFSIFTNLLYQN